eukprot:jgi/Tetstr1/433404/TSEL_022678.t1
MEEVLAGIPAGRARPAEEVAALAAFIASEEADYMSGTAVILDDDPRYPVGPDAVRVRARPGRGLVAPHVDALLPAPAGRAEIEIGADRASLTHGRIRAEITLTERYGADINFKALASGSWRLEAQFRAYEDESLWGMGSRKHGAMDLKGVSTTLLQQNAHA